MRKVTPDPEKARSLKKMSKKILDRIEKTDVEEFPSQVLQDYYDVLHQLIEAIANLDGVETGGAGAHQNLINWFGDEYDIPEDVREFLQQMRKYRNRISYEGFFVKPKYLKRNKDKISSTIDLLIKILDNKLS